MKIFLFPLIIFIISSCSSTTRLAKETDYIYGDDFFTALASGYNQLSQQEKKEYDWTDADEFAKKGLAALNKKYTAPENPLLREIPDNFVLDELVVARNKMIQIFKDNTKFLFPLKSARLQILYDYWVEQAEENWQDKDIVRFRTEFWDTYRALEASKRLAALKYKNKRPDQGNYYTINFDFNKSNIDKTADATLNQIAHLLTILDQYSIVLEGHTDLSGKEGYNYILSEKRVKSVKNALIQKGVPKEAFIREKAYSSKKPKITKNAGGYTDRQNRRVEIYIITRRLKKK